MSRQEKLMVGPQLTKLDLAVSILPLEVGREGEEREGLPIIIIIKEVEYADNNIMITSQY